MRKRQQTIRRGLSLLELLLATMITTMVAGAIAAMLWAVATGVGSRNDSRAAMVRANAANARLGSYIMPARCVLGVYPNNGIALWLDDSRESGTVHATEIRWILYDDQTESLNVYFVQFPDDWAQAAKDLADLEYVEGSDWITVLETYQTAGQIAAVPLVDALNGVTAVADDSALDAQSVYFDLELQTSAGTKPIRIASTIRYHERPTS